MLFGYSSLSLSTDGVVSRMSYTFIWPAIGPTFSHISVLLDLLSRYTFSFGNPLLWIVSVLAVGCLILILQDGEQTIEVSLLISFLALYIGLYCCFLFNEGAAGFQWLSSLTATSVYSTSLILGVDGLSFVFLMLTLTIFPFCFTAAQSVSAVGIKRFCYIFLQWNYYLS
jgi:NADH:ubiquinone oxidoreductase subunit 4 (subunit M)